MLLGLSSTSFAISEKNYITDYQNNVLPFTNSMEKGTLKSNGLNLSYRTFIQQDATSCLVILPGRSEPAVKYGELVYDLVHSSDIGKKLNYFILDHRGQGQSDRMVSPSDLGHVDYFNNYVSDLGSFLKNVVDKASCQKKFLFAHSMGAGISLRYVELNPDYFNGLMISSPMVKIQTKPYAYLVARAIIEGMMLAGQGNKFSVGQAPFNSNDLFTENTFTSSPERFEMTMKLAEIFPDTKVGGASNRWIKEVMNGTYYLRQDYYKITAPMKLYRAGDEQYSEPAEMHRMCQLVADCDELLLPTSKHEVINDRDENRDQVISSMIEFMTGLN